MDATLFSIDGKTGEVRFIASPNFEAPADSGGDNVYDVTVHANDGIHDSTKAVKITVTDVNDVTPTITSGATGTEAENTATGNVVYTVAATDPDTVGSIPTRSTGPTRPCSTSTARPAR